MTAAPLMLVGEQPGDYEDREGAPFVGPSGHLLDQALEELGIAREDLYITNAVKHFKWEQRGNVRLHKNPSAREVAACRPWLEAEIEAVRPAVIVCLGAIASRALLGPGFRVTKERGRFFPGPAGTEVTATVHPASIVRLREPEQRAEETRRLVSDLGAAVDRCRDLTGRPNR